MIHCPNCCHEISNEDIWCPHCNNEMKQQNTKRKFEEEKKNGESSNVFTQSVI